MTPSIGELGITGVALIVVWKLAGVIQAMYLHRKATPAMDRNGVGMFMTPLACQTDPKHFQRIIQVDNATQSMEKMLKGWNTRVDSGFFSCKWAGRDEIRDHDQAIKDLTREVQALSSEIRKTRNGKSL